MKEGVIDEGNEKVEGEDGTGMKCC